jgi:GNAT superfamily N-acetyltransferase
MNLHIQTATLEQLEEIVPLFDAYRVFYQQESDLERARAFIRERLYLRESVIFLAYLDGVAVGFTQLFPTFSSTTTQRLWTLNDLYVSENMRGHRIGQRLLEVAAEFAKTHGAKGLELATAVTNISGQKLYERAGFVRETHFYCYMLEV